MEEANRKTLHNDGEYFVMVKTKQARALFVISRVLTSYICNMEYSTSDKWDAPRFTTRERCITILY